jgi:hypothetical protein
MTGVMYAPGKVMTVGGNAYHNGAGFWGSRMATSIDLNGGGAVLTELPRMANARIFANAIACPTARCWSPAAKLGPTTTRPLACLQPRWNPATNTWTTLASSTVFRGYHSQSSLLPNGTVLVSGGGNPGPVQLKGDVFYPPYLFRTVNGAAQLAPRPRLIGISGLKHNHGAQTAVRPGEQRRDLAGGADRPEHGHALVQLRPAPHSESPSRRTTSASPPRCPMPT